MERKKSSQCPPGERSYNQAPASAEGSAAFGKAIAIVEEPTTP